MRKIWPFVILICVFLTCCVKDPLILPMQPSKPSGLLFHFNGQVNGSALSTGTTLYTNYSRDSFTVSKLNYYISNIRLTREDGYIYSEPQSYHLIEHAKGATSFSLAAVPVGKYISIEFLIGVDSLRNVSGSQTGALDPANAMFWDWKQGYIFFKMEGVYRTKSMTERGDYSIHIGGFKGPYACLQTCRFNLIKSIEISEGRPSSVHYNVQVDELFIKPVVIGFDYYYNNISKGPGIFRMISENYRDMFFLDKIMN